MPVRSFSKAEMLLKVRRRLELPLLLMIWSSVTMFSLAEGNYYFALAGTVTVGVNLAATIRGKEFYLSHLFVNLLVLAGAVLFITEVLGPESLSVFSEGGIPLKAITHFIMIILMGKLFERKRNRDYAQMLILSFLTVLSGSLLCEQLWYAAMALIYVSLGCYAAMALTLKRGLDRSVRTRLAHEPAPPPADQVAWNTIRDWPGRVLSRRLAAVLLAMALTGGLLFAATPRLEQVIEPLAVRGLTALSGLASTVRLGDASKIYQSDRVVMQVAVTPPADRRARLPQYFCAATATVYENSRWVVDQNSPSSRSRRHGPESIEALRLAALRQDVSMRSELLPNLPAAYPAVDVAIAVGPSSVGPDGIATAHGRARHSGHVRYTVWSWPQPLTDEQRAALDENRATAEQPVQAAGAPEGLPPRVVGLARLWCEDLLKTQPASALERDRRDLAIASRICERLSQDYTYTLDLRDADPSRDGVEDFLFHMKKGHCEYFASTLTVMCQALGVRARLMMGYRSNEVDHSTGQIIIRDRDAHAWCQVFTPSTDFVTFDPSPRTDRAAASSSWWRRIENVWSRLHFMWSQRVLGYDARARQRLAESMRRRLYAAAVWCRDQSRQMGRSVRNFVVYGKADLLFYRLTYAVTSVTALVGLIVLARYLVSRQRRRRAIAAGRAVPPSHLVFMEGLLRALARRGCRGGPAQTPRELLAVAADRFGWPGEDAASLLQFYYAVRWGNRSVTAHELADARRRADRLGRMLRR